MEIDAEPFGDDALEVHPTPTDHPILLTIRLGLDKFLHELEMERAHEARRLTQNRDAARGWLHGGNRARGCMRRQI